MKKQAIIPLFIPHLGCPHDCVFCNQKTITACDDTLDSLSPAKIVETMEIRLKDLEPLKLPHIEAAFYGGSFTGLTETTQSTLLAALVPYKQSGQIQKIRISTRPDYITPDILKRLSENLVDIIELGAQSFDDQVLLLSGRGHTVSETESACRLITSSGFQLGIQLMVGLPGDTKEIALSSAQKAVDLNPDFIRIYPTVVLSGSKLAEEFLDGRFLPISQSEAIDTVKEMVRIFQKNHIPVIRIGLKSTDNITVDNDLSGTYHPAFRQLVESSLAYDDIVCQIHALEMVANCMILYANPASFSNLIGHKGCNKRNLQALYPQINFEFRPDKNMPKGTYLVTTQQADPGPSSLSDHQSRNDA